MNHWLRKFSASTWVFRDCSGVFAAELLCERVAFAQGSSNDAWSIQHARLFEHCYLCTLTAAIMSEVPEVKRGRGRPPKVASRAIADSEQHMFSAGVPIPAFTFDT